MTAPLKLLVLQIKTEAVDDDFFFSDIQDGDVFFDLDNNKTVKDDIHHLLEASHYIPRFMAFSLAISNN